MFWYSASSDGSAEMLREEFPPERYPQLRYILLEENNGVAARNLLAVLAGDEPPTPVIRGRSTDRA